MTEHICKAIVAHCLDFRLQKNINDWLQRKFGLGDYDRLSLAGGVFDLEYVIGQVKKSRDLHKIQKVVFINHEDCGAYGEENSPDRHATDLRKAGQRIKKEIPGIEVELYYLHLTGIFDPIPSS